MTMSTASTCQLEMALAKSGCVLGPVSPVYFYTMRLCILGTTGSNYYYYYFFLHLEWEKINFKNNNNICKLKKKERHMHPLECLLLNRSAAASLSSSPSYTHILFLFSEFRGGERWRLRLHFWGHCTGRTSSERPCLASLSSSMSTCHHSLSPVNSF